jgi:hypothetical protein
MHVCNYVCTLTLFLFCHYVNISSAISLYWNITWNIIEWPRWRLASPNTCHKARTCPTPGQNTCLGSKYLSYARSNYLPRFQTLTLHQGKLLVTSPNTWHKAQTCPPPGQITCHKFKYSALATYQVKLLALGPNSCHKAHTCPTPDQITCPRSKYLPQVQTLASRQVKLLATSLNTCPKAEPALRQVKLLTLGPNTCLTPGQITCPRSKYLSQGWYLPYARSKYLP